MKNPFPENSEKGLTPNIKKSLYTINKCAIAEASLPLKTSS